jgi:hypothetical protein
MTNGNGFKIILKENTETDNLTLDVFGLPREWRFSKWSNNSKYYEGSSFRNSRHEAVTDAIKWLERMSN